MSIQRIKKNDIVIAVSGAIVGKSGKVMQILPGRNRLIVEGVNMVKKCLRKSQDHPQGGISEKEASIPISKVMLLCPTCKKGVRTVRVKQNDQMVRKCKRCGNLFEGSVK
ncbi:MAG: 50S ribosomal protein L24 [Kiritimatiellae bacterium]|nr:50S ribosomal protein L24 [Kiritimatiellia bacterium]MDD5522239.1 50S ribosomal protein L24 [Kiritimatiellia bacterium]